MGQGGRKNYPKEVEQQAANEIGQEMKKPQKLSKAEQALEAQARTKAKEISPDLKKLGLTDTRAPQKRIVGRDAKISQLKQRMADAKERGAEMDAQVAEYRAEFETSKRDAIHKDVSSLTKRELSALDKKSQKPPIPDRATKPPVLPKTSSRNKKPNNSIGNPDL